MYTKDSTDTILSVADGTLRVPCIRLGTYTFVVSRKPGPLFGSDGYVSASAYKDLISEVMGMVYRHLVAMSCYGGDPSLRWRRKSLPRMDHSLFTEVRCRIFTASVEGLLHGICLWDASKHAGKSPTDLIKAYVGHALFWADQFADWEATIIRGEVGGLVVDIELSLKEKLGSAFRHAKACASLVGRYVQEFGEIPSKSEMFSYAKESGYRNASAVANCLSAPDFYGDAKTLYNLSVGDIPYTLGRCLDGVALTDNLQALVQVRQQLFRAMADDGLLTADTAEIVDLLWFGALPLESHDYHESDTSQEVLCVLSKLDLCRSDHRRRDLEDKLRRLYEDNWVSIPAIGGLASPGMLTFPAGPITCDGISQSCSHLRASRGPWPRVQSAALERCVREVLQKFPGMGAESARALVTTDDFKASVREVRFVRNAVRHRGYFDAESGSALRTIAELHRLETACLGALYDTQGRPLARTSPSGNVPMMAWFSDDTELPVHLNPHYFYQTFPRYSAVEDLKRFEDSMPGNLTEKRCILVRCRPQESLFSVHRNKVVSRFGKKHRVDLVAHYAVTIKDVPKSSIRVGDVRTPGSTGKRLSVRSSRRFLSENR